MEKAVNKAMESRGYLLSVLMADLCWPRWSPRASRMNQSGKSADLAGLLRDKPAVLPTHRMALGSRDKLCCRLCVATDDLAHDLP